MIKRRKVLVAFGLNALVMSAGMSLAIAAPPQGKVLRVGLLDGTRDKFDPVSNPVDRALVNSLREHGYELGRDIIFDYRGALGNMERVSEFAAELVRLKVDMIVTVATGATLAAREATKTIPIIMLGAADPVATGIVASLSRPGGNITGMSYNASEISAKRLQLLQEAIPKVSRVAVLWNSSYKAMTLGFQQIEKAAPILGMTIQSIRVSSSDEFDKAFAVIAQGHIGGLIVLFGPMRGNDLPRVVEFVTRNRIPTIFEIGRGVRDGGLMEFGPNFTELARHVGAYVDKIANGARPADLPVEEPSRFELIINLKAARAMGLTIPGSLLVRADQVIE